jgi:hypothetical protein
MAHHDDEVDNVIIKKDYWREEVKSGSLYEHSYRNLSVVTLHVCISLPECSMKLYQRSKEQNRQFLKYVAHLEYSVMTKITQN